MALNHQQFVKERFGREILLFNELATGEHTSVFDIGEVVPVEEGSEEENRHIIWTVQYIHAHIPAVYDYIQAHDR